MHAIFFHSLYGLLLFNKLRLEAFNGSQPAFYIGPHIIHPGYFVGLSENSRTKAS